MAKSDESSSHYNRSGKQV